MGELRSVLNGPKDEPCHVWARVCSLLDDWPDDGSLEQLAIPYISSHLAQRTLPSRVAPLHWLKLPEHAELPRMALCDGLNLQDVYPELVQSIITSAHIQGVKELCLFQPADFDDPEALDAALSALLRAPKLATLERLYDWEGRIPVEAIQRLLSTQGPATLSELYLGACGWGALRGCARIGQLKGLTLGRRPHDAQDVAALLSEASALASFGLVQQQLGVEALAALAAHAPATLVALQLTGVALDDEGIEALCAGSFMARARTLILSDNDVGDAGLIALLDASRVLESLILRDNPITARGLAALVEHPHAASLSHVGLNLYALDEEARALCASNPRLKQLT